MLHNFTRLPVDGAPLVLVPAGLNLKLDLVVGRISRKAERLGLCDRWNDEHAVLQKIANVPAVEQVGESNGKGGDVLLVRVDDVLPKNVARCGVHLPQRNTNSTEDLVDFFNRG